MLAKIMIIQFICLWVLSNPIIAQKRYAWPYYNVSKGRFVLYNHTPIQPGIIVYRNGDSLKGQIKIPPGYEFNRCSIIPEGTMLRLKNIIDVYPEQIKNIRIYDDSAETRYTDIVSLKYKNKERLWRLLGKNNSASIYDDAINTYDNTLAAFKYEDPYKSNYYTIAMMLVTGNEAIRIYHRPHLAKPYGIVLEFINKRFKTHFEKKDFNSTGDLIKYILKKEGKKNS